MELEGQVEGECKKKNTPINMIGKQEGTNPKNSMDLNNKYSEEREREHNREQETTHKWKNQLNLGKSRMSTA